MLVGLGVVAAVLHVSFRWPLRLPGHHGLEWLALLMAARMVSQRPGAALAVAVGAAATALTAAGGHDAFLRPATYLLQGLVLDGLWLLLQGRLAAPLLAVVLGAVVHALAPMLKNLVAVATDGGLAMSSLAQGLAFPLATHAAFGAVGAAAGALAVLAWRHRRAGSR